MSVIGKTANIVSRGAVVAGANTIKLSGKAVGKLGEKITGKEEVYETISGAAKKAGDVVMDYNKNVGDGVEKVVDKTVEVTGKVKSVAEEGISKIKNK